MSWKSVSFIDSCLWLLWRWVIRLQRGLKCNLESNLCENPEKSTLFMLTFWSCSIFKDEKEMVIDLNNYVKSIGKDSKFLKSRLWRFGFWIKSLVNSTLISFTRFACMLDLLVFCFITKVYRLFSIDSKSESLNYPYSALMKEYNYI